MTEPMTLYKLIILYMLDKVSFPLTNAQLSDFILEEGYTNYFTLQQVLSELSESGLIRLETIRNATHYSSTPQGNETLNYFKDKISQAIRNDIDSYLKDHKIQLRNTASVIANYYKNTSHEYEVNCVVKEKDSDLVNLTLTVPSAEEAEQICKNWDKKCQQIYGILMKELLLDSPDLEKE